MAQAVDVQHSQRRAFLQAALSLARRPRGRAVPTGGSWAIRVAGREAGRPGGAAGAGQGTISSMLPAAILMYQTFCVKLGTGLQTARSRVGHVCLLEGLTELTVMLAGCDPAWYSPPCQCTMQHGSCLQALRLSASHLNACRVYAHLPTYHRPLTA